MAIFNSFLYVHQRVVYFCIETHGDNWGSPMTDLRKPQGQNIEARSSDPNIWFVVWKMNFSFPYIGNNPS